MKNMMKYNDLPERVREEIKRVCKVYDKAYVTYENGEYKTSSMIGITNGYAPDHKFIGVYNVEEVFTEDERTENYINVFYAYPIWYKGERDYQMLKKLQKDKEFDFENDTVTHWVGKLINGNFELTERVTVKF